MKYYYLRTNTLYNDEELLSEAVFNWLSENNHYPSEEMVEEEIRDQVEEWEDKL